MDINNVSFSSMEAEPDDSEYQILDDAVGTIISQTQEIDLETHEDISIHEDENTHDNDNDTSNEHLSDDTNIAEASDEDNIENDEEITDHLSTSEAVVASCAICLEELRENVFELTCGHSFHWSCIEQWFIVSQTCPICRENADIILI